MNMDNKGMKRIDCIKKMQLFLNIVCIIGVFVTSTWLFYRQYVRWDYSRSDLQSHTFNSATTVTYSLFDSMLGLIYRVSNQSVLWCSVFMGIIIVLTGLSAFILLNYLSKQYSHDYEDAITTNMLISVAYMLMFVSSIYVPVLSPFFYSRNTYGTQPWHNPTYIGMRLISYIMFAVCIETMKHYKDKVNGVLLVLYSATFFVCNWMKPNYGLALSVAVLIYMLVDFVDIFFVKRKGSIIVFGRMILFGVCNILGCSVVFFQNNKAFSEEEQSEIILYFDRMFEMLKNPRTIFFIIFGLLFPIYVGYLMKKCKFRSFAYKFAWVVYLVCFVQGVFINQTGWAYMHGNFTWGEGCCASILFACSIVELREMKCEGLIADGEYYGGIAVFLMHIISGMIYYALLFSRSLFQF